VSGLHDMPWTPRASRRRDVSPGSGPCLDRSVTELKSPRRKDGMIVRFSRSMGGQEILIIGKAAVAVQEKRGRVFQSLEEALPFHLPRG